MRVQVPPPAPLFVGRCQTNLREKGGRPFEDGPPNSCVSPPLTDQLSHSVTFGQSNRLSCSLPSAYVPIDGFFLGVDFPDGQFACDTPLTRYVADVRDVLMSTLTIRFGNACHIKFFHCHNPFVRGPLCMARIACWEAVRAGC